MTSARQQAPMLHRRAVMTCKNCSMSDIGVAAILCRRTALSCGTKLTGNRLSVPFAVTATAADVF